MTYTKCTSYKYQLQADLVIQLKQLFKDVSFDWVSIKDDVLTIRKGYAWDGASGPTVDTKNSMTGALVHDALYQLMRLKLLDATTDRVKADREFYRLLRENGMSWLRAKAWYISVRLFAKKSATKLQTKEKIIEA